MAYQVYCGIAVVMAAIFVPASLETPPSLTLTFTMKEEMAIGYPVGSILEEGVSHFNVSEPSKLSFSLLLPDTLIGMFTINDESGTIYTGIQIDRETECELQVVCLLKFQVTVLYDAVFKMMVDVEVNIEDINDNNPEFPKTEVTLYVPEDSQINETFRLDSPTDSDYGGNNSIQTITLVAEDDPEGAFRLLKEFNGRFSLKVSVNAALDRERKESYKLKVIARDGGEPPLSGSLIVNIQITDSNDNDPVFSQSTYNVTIDESTAVNRTIVTLTANDSDTGDNGRVSYRIQELQSNKAEIDELFAVLPDNGHLIVKSDLTYMAGKSFSFSVVVEDHGAEPRQDQAEVIVYIRDSINDAPKVTAIVPPTGKSLPESSTIKTYVAHVNVEDTDSGPNGEIACTVSDAHFGIEDIGGGRSYIVVVASALDYEVQKQHNVTVTCVDNGNPALSGTAFFLVSVTDMNDNRPVFVKPTYTARLQENNEGTESILQVSARDSDSGSNAVIQYSMHEDANGRFSVDKVTGVVFVTKVLDRETTPVITFHVLAYDGGVPALTGTAEVTITVDDENDKPPEFNKTLHAMEIRENMISGTSVGQLLASDGDLGRNAEFDFSLAPHDSGKVPFDVFAHGLIKSNKELDREEKSRYDFMVVVTDHGDSALSSSAHVTVFVMDANDNVPVITFPSEANHTITVWYPDFESEYLVTIEGYDDDEGENKELLFAIKSGNELGIFGINEQTGELFFDSQVDIGSDLKVTLTVAISDRGSPRLESTADLIVELKYTNATFTETAAQGEDSTYIIISVVVVVVTLLLSGGIIAVILFLRTLDRKRKQREVEAEEQSRTDSDFGFAAGHVNGTMATVDGVSTSTSSSDPDQGFVKKKEVSFILDTSDPANCYQQRPTGSLPHLAKPSKSLLRSPSNPSPCPGERPETLECEALQEKANAQLQSLKLQQLMLQNRAKQWVQQQQQQQQFGGSPPPHHHDDGHSETSAETIGSDSGRGCSEEDDTHSSPSADDPKTFDLSHPQTNVRYSPPQTVIRANTQQANITNTSAYKPVTRQPWTRKAHLANRDYRPSHNNMRYQYEDMVARNYQNMRYHSNQIPHGNSYYTSESPMDFTGDSALHSFFDKTPVTFGREDDDNCSTTTSGSYTVYSEEIL